MSGAFFVFGYGTCVGVVMAKRKEGEADMHVTGTGVHENKRKPGT